MGHLLGIRCEGRLADDLKAVLCAGGHDCEFCEGDVEAIHRVRDHPIDVVVTDPTTSIGEDLALALELRATQPGIRTIVLAPAASHHDLVQAIRAHVFACFTVPFEPMEIAGMALAALRESEWNDGIEVVSGLPHWMTLRVACRRLTADRLIRFMTEHQSALPEADRDLLMAAFREMLLNAMEHGAGFAPDKVVEVTAARTARAIVYHFRDPGRGFDRENLQHTARTNDPAEVIAATTRRASMGLRAGGFGMLIVKEIVDELVYNEQGNEVILVKHLD
jgi:anti-sigma regulatory factor (Ser/Thr protein kinase)